jgi:hypothetical protein
VLESGGTPAITAAYRSRTELTARDKEVLDGIANELWAGMRQSKQSGYQQTSGDRPGPVHARALLKEVSALHGGVHGVAETLGLKLHEVEAEGFDGALIRARNAPLGAIAVRASMRETGRKNFTIAHEIGHFVLPGHEKGSVACTASEVGEWTDAPSEEDFEREANEFAAELLMPLERVEVIARSAPLSLDVVEKIAREFAVSLSAAAYRYCELASEPCAVVWSSDGAVQWAKRSSRFPHFLPRGKPIEDHTFAAACFSGEKVPRQPRAVPAHLWITSASAGSTIRIFEQSKSLPSYHSVITLLWIREDAQTDR